VAFHVRLRTWLRTHDAFNLSEKDVKAGYVDPWRRGEALAIRGRAWAPGRATITIIEGPELMTSQRSLGRGWSKAQELGEDVTDCFLRAGTSGAEPPFISEVYEVSAPLTLPGGDGRARPGRAADAFFAGRGTRVGVAATVLVGLLGVAVALLVSSHTSPGARATATSGTGALIAPASSAPPGGIGSAADLGQYVLSRPIWQAPPSVLPDSLDIAFDDQAVSLGYTPVADNGGEPIAYSVPELVTIGASLAGEPVYVVGRIVSAVKSPVGTGGWTASPAEDIVLEGPGGGDRVYGLASALGASAITGEIVFFPAVVAAVGELAGGRPTAYVISLDDPVPTSSFGATGGDTVLSLARRFGREAAPPSSP
jgi:hypothetical protein